MVVNEGAKVERLQTRDVPFVNGEAKLSPELKPIQVTAAYKGKDKVAYELSKNFFDSPRDRKSVV